MAVDEHMVPLKCQSSMKQYMSMKPARHRCKIWCLAYLRTEFVNSLIYIFKEKRCDMQGGMKLIHSTLNTSHPHRVTSTKCRIDTVISPDDGYIVTRNM